MSDVIKKVPTTYIPCVFLSAHCDDCGHGSVIYHEEDGHVLTNIPDNGRLVGSSCECKGKITLDYKSYKRKILGYTLVKCDCGREVECDSFTNTCSCGADYNFSGTKLAPREQWGEETNEHWTDIIRAGRNNNWH